MCGGIDIKNFKNKKGIQNNSNQKITKIITMFILLLLFATTINAIITKNSIDLYAITNEGNGVKAELTIEIKSGTGQIFTSINPLIGKTTQSTQRTAVKIAENYFPFSNNFDYFFTIDSAATEVDGPSAGGAIT